MRRWDARGRNIPSAAVTICEIGPTCENGGMVPKDDDMPTSAVRRAARLARLPLGAAGRATRGLGRRLGGASKQSVSDAARAEAAEQVFRVLGEMKGGAMKVGQTLSLFEAFWPEEMVGPYRTHLRRLQDQAPPMPTSRVHQVLERELGAEWKSLFRDFSARPAAAASIGQVHRAVWAATGQPVAVKVQYPGADVALKADLDQLQRLGHVLAPLAGGMDIRPLMADIARRVADEVDYEIEAEAQQQAADGFEGHAEFVVPHVVHHSRRVMVSEWIDGRSFASVAEDDPDTRNELALRYVKFLFAGPQEVGLLHGDPHPGNFKVLDDGRLGIIDFGLVDRLPDGLPPAIGDLISIANRGDAATVTEGLRTEGFLLPRSGDVDPQELLDFLGPFLEPARTPEFHFTREWMQQEFSRVMASRDTRIARQLNLPQDYVLIERVWLGGIAVLSQMDVRANFQQILDAYLPSWR